MKKIVFGLCLIGLVGCGRRISLPEPLDEKTPQVLYALPHPGAIVPVHPKIAVLFSQSIEESSLNPQSVVLSRGKIEDRSYPDVARLMKDIDEGDLVTAPLDYSLQEEGKILVLEVREDLLPGEAYTLCITPRVLSKDRVPLNQTPKKDMTPFVAAYQVVEGAADQPTATTEATNATDAADTDNTANEEFDQVLGEVLRQGVEEVPSPISPEVSPIPDPIPAPVQAPVQTPIEIPVQVPSVPSPAPSPSPSLPENDPGPFKQEVGPVVLNEIYYDAVGSDTDGVLFLELHGAAGLEIGGYRIDFVNGEDGKVYQSLSLPAQARMVEDGFYLIADSKTGSTTETRVSGSHAADFITNFDPQNGPDSVQLFDASGVLRDAVSYGSGVSSEGPPAPDVVNGHSLERREAGLDSGDNQSDFVERDVPTPGF